VSDPKARSHLVERAMEALGGAQTLLRSTMPAQPPAAVAAPPPAPPPPPEAAPGDDPGPADAAPAVSLDTMRRAGLVVAPGGLERNRASEEMTVVQHQVLRTLRSTQDSEGRCSRVILITSARPGEGKTFTALNLAASIAVGGGRPTVLVDVDGKRGSISELLGLADAPGIRMLASDPKLPPASLPVLTELPQLAVLPFGVAAFSGSELPPGSTVVTAIQRLAAALPNHIFVLDSPPCLSTSDPSNLAPLVGQVIMVVQAERTQRDEVEAALDLVEACPTLQLVLNQTRMTSNDSFGAYGAYDVYRPYGARSGA
jgi:receptor protein-tyrosine kinase